MQNIVVFGAAGQLGQCLKKVAADRAIENIFYLSSVEGNILDADVINTAFQKYKPTFVINCAAYTAVDKAEDEVEQARAINKTGVANLAAACKSYNATLIHISTDFVFNGDIPHPLSEGDATAPIGVYGLTKLEGEEAIAAVLDKHYIIRTSWLYSEYGNNFVKTMLKLGADRDLLKIIADQVGTPTYAIDLAACVLDIISSAKENYGIYHYSNEGVASWFDFAKAVFDISNTNVKVLPIGTAEYPTKAKRPAYSVMNKAKIKSTFDIEIPYWRDSLVVCLNVLLSNK
ncbi:dTDP-4-dehydrorhamnose reductase [Mucilaginibacter pineti]|uniref:dTDP-4-dehydrorhamnose reductase n=1 Tax=Mucilaginibacter pineti TaxID=1391627 RepID=A0A1G6WD22_9SPHI|nr:dTDP-4-dehydrorhamnose reductase [Mucilaginibacter pineti]SDD62955.1 dTDP-4-dehydrorhamnose reductase [Mucilaginibacter pineti]